ncbi:uncharacterized protein LOC131230717 [Magnolia sinica]|uniref:uncharacterized protein LOC131230717 n=1 Tax=Magnolia sinica TaxID=86752 RepID=UPI0026588AAD|nr:uncharacterized protein LOC131230717 [Magnolia sinica]
MGSEASSSPSGKRSRDPEDEIYLDNLHSHKRYLSEIMASSLNGLTVGDSMSENLMESPARSEGMNYYPRDEISSQYSPMSEDSDDSRYCDNPLNTSMAQPDSLSTFIGPVSPHRHQRLLAGYSSPPPTHSYPSFGCTPTSTACSQPRQRGSDSEGRFPSSPSDICHSADLRRAALLRSVQMRVQPHGPPAYELPYSSEQETMQNIDHAEDPPCPYVKPLVDERDYQSSRQVPSMLLDECSTMGLSESGARREKCYRMMNFNLKGEESGEDVFGGNGPGRMSLVSSRRSVLRGSASK